MSEKEQSVGKTSPREPFRLREEVELKHGGKLAELEVAFETYGDSSKPAVLVCHALSGDQHAAGEAEVDYPHSRIKQCQDGWWDLMIGPGKAIDTNRFFVISSNNIGGCDGSTGPRSVNPATGQPYGSNFPAVAVEDWVRAQHLLVTKQLGIDKLHAVVGGSIGGMQALSWALKHPDMVANAVIIAATAKLTQQNLAFNEVARYAIEENAASTGDEKPATGLAVARMLANVTYRSAEYTSREFKKDMMHQKGEEFAQAFDHNSYLLALAAMEAFDPACDHGSGDLTRAVQDAKSRFLVVSFKKDWRFSADLSRDLVAALLDAGKYVSYAELKAAGGHDAFLKDDEVYHDVVRGFLQQEAQA